MIKPIKELLYPIVEKSKYYLEPFVGGGSVMVQVAKDFPDKKIVVNDKDETISSFWSLIAYGNDRDFRKLFDLINGEPGNFRCPFRGPEFKMLGKFPGTIRIIFQIIPVCQIIAKKNMHDGNGQCAICSRFQTDF